MKDNNADGPESLIDMKTAKLSVVDHSHDDDWKRFPLMRLYERNIAETTSYLWTQLCLSYPTPPNIKLGGEVCLDDPELRRVLMRGQSSNESCWLINNSI